MTRSSIFPALQQRVDTVLGGVVAALMGAAVLNVLWQVFARYVLESPSPYSDELARFLLIWVGLLGASFAAGKRMHLAIDLFPNKLSGRSRSLLLLFIELLVLLFAFFVLVFGGFRLVMLTLMLEQTSAALRIPLGYVYLALPLSGLLMMFYAVLHMLEHLHALRSHEPPAREVAEPSAEAFANAVTPSSRAPGRVQPDETHSSTPR